jgi:hypothetical protein
VLPCLNKSDVSKSRCPDLKSRGWIFNCSCLLTSSFPSIVDISSILGGCCQYCQLAAVLKPPSKSRLLAASPRPWRLRICHALAIIRQPLATSLSSANRVASMRTQPQRFTKTMMLPRHEYWHCAPSTSTRESLVVSTSQQASAVTCITLTTNTYTELRLASHHRGCFLFHRFNWKCC